MAKPVVAIVGRQNVGKSTLINRLAGRRVAIIEDLPGTTRDRLVADVSWRGYDFTLVDTGGIEINPQTSIGRSVNEQVKKAIEDADLVLFLVVVTDGLTPVDHEVADMLRQTRKPIIVVANKADNARLEAGASEFYQLGLGDPFPISAHHGRGTAELLDKIIEMLPALAPAEATTEFVKVAIVGRPGVGKSMLLNSLVGEERVIVSDTPGTTRDAVDTLLDVNGKNVLLIDTAGIRRRGRVEGGVEKYSVLRAHQAIDRSDIVLLVVEATEPLTAQDLHIAGYIQEAAKGIILVINKWDLVSSAQMNEWEAYIKEQLRFMPYAKVLYVSAKAGKNVDQIIPEVMQIYEERQKRLTTAVVNNVIQEAAASHPLPRRGSRHLKLLYVTQAEVNPPTFVFFVNDPKLVHFSYQRFLENRLRAVFGFAGTPIRLVFKGRGE